MWQFTKKSVIGLDIGSSVVKLLELRELSQGRYLLENFGVAHLPSEAIVDGALMNSAAVADAIRDLITTYSIKAKSVSTSVSGHSVIIKRITLPAMTEDELEESIAWEAEQYIPFDISDVNIDFQIISPEVDEQGQMDVLLVAAKKELINDYTSVIQEAGLNPVVVDVDSFALGNMFELNYPIEPGQTIVLIDIGASTVNINILKDGLSVLTRDVSFGGNQFTEEVQKSLNVSYDEAEALKLGKETGEEADEVIPQEVQKVIKSVSDNLIAELQRSLDFYATTTMGEPISRIFLSGGASKTSGFAESLEARVGIPVEGIDPFRNIEINDKTVDMAVLKEFAPLAGVSVGLALRRPGD